MSKSYCKKNYLSGKSNTWFTDHRRHTDDGRQRNHLVINCNEITPFILGSLDLDGRREQQIF